MDIKASVDLLQRAVQIAPGFAESVREPRVLARSRRETRRSRRPRRCAARSARQPRHRHRSNLADAWGARAFARFALE
jgi:hypothetical protein